MRTVRFERSPIQLLRRAGRCADNIFSAGIGDMTERQLAVLEAVGKHEGSSQTMLVEITGVDRSTMADVVRQLKWRGLVQRRRTATDARTYTVKLTSKGRGALRSLQPALEAADQLVLASLPETLRELFLNGLQSVIDELE
jgi:DNA-binding MarR family transcriptional regulator